MNSIPLDNQTRLWDMVAGAGPMVKLVLAILLVFSVVSWAIIVYKVMILRRMERESKAFSEIFWKSRQFAEISSASAGFKRSPLASLFSAVYAELSSKTKAHEAGKIPRDDLDRLQRALKKAVAVENARLEYSVPFLATASNTAPFIGLFGTVWGIMTSFRSIGLRGAANLAVVAPGISEALVATAMGLLVAIPAAIGYNHILSRMNRVSADMDNFAADLLNIIQKYY